MWKRARRRGPGGFAAVCIVSVCVALPHVGTAQTPVSETETLTRRLTREIIAPAEPRPRPPLASDAEHARSIDPVLTGGTAIWIHDAPGSPPLTVLGGRVFNSSTSAGDLVDAPFLKVRPIDDDQVVPFLMRVVIVHDGEVSDDAFLTVSFPAPPIFDPRVLHTQAWVGSAEAEVAIESSLEEARLEVRVSLARTDPEAAETRGETLTVIIAGDLVLAPYRPMPARRFSDHHRAPVDKALAGLAALEVGRDIDAQADVPRFEEIVDGLRARSSTAYDLVVAVSSWVGHQLEYREGPATRTAVEALEDRRGDCDEHTTLTVALLRAAGIPARRAHGLLYNFDTPQAHTWVEVVLPLMDGSPQWFIVDPTLAGTTPLEAAKASFVQFRDRSLLYPIMPSIHADGLTGRTTTDILFTGQTKVPRDSLSSVRTAELIDRVTSSVDRGITNRVSDLVEGGFLFLRDSASLPDSPYLLVDRVLADRPEIGLQLRLESGERLVLDLTADQGTELDHRAVDGLREVYADLSHDLFAGRTAYHNLELVFVRDPHSDRLHTVSLRVGRYLVEHELHRVLRRLNKAALVTADEVTEIAAAADASGGNNLYTLQELARQLPPQARAGAAEGDVEIDTDREMDRP